MPDTMPDTAIRFLVVDDIAENILALDALLRRDGLIVDHAQSASEALELMRPGDEWIVWIPPALGYGDKDSGPIPANSVLRFRERVLEDHLNRALVPAERAPVREAHRFSVELDGARGRA